MQLDEGVPGRIVSIAALRAWLDGLWMDPRLFEDPLHRIRTDLRMQLQELADNPAVAPTRVLPSKPNNGLANILAKFPGELPGAADLAGAAAWRVGSFDPR